MLFTPAVLAALVEDRRGTIARDLEYARSIRVRRTVAALVHRLGASVTALGNVLDEEPSAAEPAAVHPVRSRAR